MAAGGENRWPYLGRNRWPLTLVELQLPTERSKHIRRAPPVSVKRALPVPHKRPRQASQRPQAASAIPQSRSGASLEHTSAPAPIREYPRHAVNDRQNSPLAIASFPHPG
jgi:hypothetical protein